MVGRFSAAEVWEYCLEDYHHFCIEFGKVLATALSYLLEEDIRSILSKAFIIPFEYSCYFSEKLVRGRGVILIDTNDLKDTQRAVVTIIHEAGHAFLGHGHQMLVDTEQYEHEEDECWDQVRKWLPREFHPCIEELETKGGGTRGLGYLEQSKESQKGRKQ